MLVYFCDVIYFRQTPKWPIKRLLDLSLRYWAVFVQNNMECGPGLITTIIINVSLAWINASATII